MLQHIGIFLAAYPNLQNYSVHKGFTRMIAIVRMTEAMAWLPELAALRDLAVFKNYARFIGIAGVLVSDDGAGHPTPKRSISPRRELLSSSTLI